MVRYTRIREEHWLRDRHDDGSVVILEDESMWEIHPSDRPPTAHWLRGSTIMVSQIQKEADAYLLTNRTESETARANYVGQVRAA
jgi:hypothetical protein